MADFNSLWNAASSILDNGVDGILGDRIQYRHGGVFLGDGSPRVIPAFIVWAVAPINIDEIDETLGNRRRVKVAKALVDEPVQSDRIAHPNLGPGWYRPAGNAPDDGGRYWIFDVQRASAP